MDIVSQSSSLTQAISRIGIHRMKQQQSNNPSNRQPLIDHIHGI